SFNESGADGETVSYNDTEYDETPHGGEFDLNGIDADEKTEEAPEFEFIPEPISEQDEPFETPELSLVDDEDAEEFGEEGVVENAVSEFDGPVSLNDVFGTLGSYNDSDFEAVYGDGEEAADDDSNDMISEEILERRKNADDDSNEFYSENDAEFEPFTLPDAPTAEIGSIAGEPDPAPHVRKRWKIRRSMTITDEFKAVKSEENDD
ncbi:MAG: hypothetical protein IJM71_07525, partial [Clostridia bacterium]|nr:hypothetical protein [Clostridia bacterium]